MEAKRSPPLKGQVLDAPSAPCARPLYAHGFGRRRWRAGQVTNVSPRSIVSSSGGVDGVSRRQNGARIVIAKPWDAARPKGAQGARAIVCP